MSLVAPRSGRFDFEGKAKESSASWFRHALIPCFPGTDNADAGEPAAPLSSVAGDC
ncbi:MAG: hypothetical protein U0165_16350 [Polyangiaceae bacterium]